MFKRKYVWSGMGLAVLLGLAVVGGKPGAAQNDSGFGPGMLWHASFCYGDELCGVGDFDGSGQDDIVAFVRSTKTDGGEGDVWVALSTGSGFSTGSVWHGSFCYGEEVCTTGDVNGDGKDDIIAFVRSTKTDNGAGDVWVALSTGSGFGASAVWHGDFCYRDEVCRVADVNGDGRDDIVAFVQNPASPANVWVALSTGSSFGASAIWYDDFCVFAEAVCTLGDFDGDADADAVMFLRNSAPDLMGADERLGRVDVALSSGDSFGTYASQHDSFCWGGEICDVGDFNGDGKDDIAAFVRSVKTDEGAGDVWIALSNMGGSMADMYGALSPILAVGGHATVTAAGNDMMVFTGTSLGSQIAGRLYTGAMLDVLEGPVSAEGYTWWRIQEQNSGLTGWVTEIGMGEVWIVVAP